MDDTRVISDARLLARSLGKLPEPEAQPTFIVVSGLPGTGKSYFCRHLAERLPFLVLESDALRQSLFSSPTYSAEESLRLFRAINYLIEGLLRKGIPLVLDATNLSERHRERLYNIAERWDVRLILVRVEAPPDLVLQRLRARAEGKDAGNKSEAGWMVYQKMKPTMQKIHHHHYTVDTSKDITAVLDKIVREAKR
jgi:predicted kinase